MKLWPHQRAAIAATRSAINANQGASPVGSDTEEELDKLRHALLYGADTVMDLSTGGKLDECRQAIIDNSTAGEAALDIGCNAGYFSRALLDGGLASGEFSRCDRGKVAKGARGRDGEHGEKLGVGNGRRQ